MITFKKEIKWGNCWSLSLEVVSGAVRHNEELERVIADHLSAAYNSFMIVLNMP